MKSVRSRHVTFSGQNLARLRDLTCLHQNRITSYDILHWVECARMVIDSLLEEKHSGKWQSKKTGPREVGADRRIDLG